MNTQEISQAHEDFKLQFAYWMQKGAHPGSVVALFPMLTGTLQQEQAAGKFLLARCGQRSPVADDAVVENAREVGQARSMVRSEGLPQTPDEIEREFDPTEGAVLKGMDARYGARSGRSAAQLDYKPRLRTSVNEDRTLAAWGAGEDLDLANAGGNHPRRFIEIPPTMDTSLWD